MRHSLVMCQCCGKMMVPRTSYSRSYQGWGGGRPVSNHCPFCLSENWDGSMPTLQAQVYALLGIGLGVLACILVGAFLMKIQWWLGIEHKYELLTWMTYVLAVYAGYRFYRWFANY